jgi:hypothetical protein
MFPALLMLDERQSEEIAGELVLFAEEADRFNGSLWAIRHCFLLRLKTLGHMQVSDLPLANA